MLSFLLFLCLTSFVDSLRTDVIGGILHTNIKIKDPPKPIYFDIRDYLHETWHHECHLPKTNNNGILKSTDMSTDSHCATFRGGHVCCYVDKYGWMPVYDEKMNDETFFTIGDMGQHNAGIP